MRVSDVAKAKAVLSFEATTSLEVILDEVIPWIREQVRAGRL
jgi:nucleoside-diphosphate-sugar epimerase